MKKWIFIFSCVGIVVLLFFFRVAVKDIVYSFLKPDLPQPKSAVAFRNNSPASPIEFPPSAPVKQDRAPSLPISVNLDIPFAPQAPFANWALPYQEACEEAAIIMAHRFFTDEPLDPKTMDEEILKLVEWEKKTFGYYEHTTAEEIARILREYFGHTKIEVKYDWSIDDLKHAVSAGFPVIIPAAGRLLGNPYFRQPGPLYHALVIKGYTKTKIITNDPGTKRGRDFLYDPEFIMNAAHDWHPEDITRGRRAMIVVYPLEAF